MDSNTGREEKRSMTDAYSVILTLSIAVIIYRSAALDGGKLNKYINATFNAIKKLCLRKL